MSMPSMRVLIKSPMAVTLVKRPLSEVVLGNSPGLQLNDLVSVPFFLNGERPWWSWSWSADDFTTLSNVVDAQVARAGEHWTLRFEIVALEAFCWVFDEIED